MIHVNTVPKSKATYKVQRLRGTGFYYFGNLDQASAYANQVIARWNIFLAITEL